ncbi:MAG TPA: response regulator [Candidatus Desulfofervidus auxilii]|uniref:Response regulator n=1 Tax=Desulfofervidus auxilii TaxID=1621989 RepID=A0A7C0Y4Y5_DESA2|nr:response regulator [Candidatus Desulfofervidus auxilii]
MMNILIVDDSATMRKIILRTIRQSGYAVDDVLEAGNGKEALEVVKNNKVDLILTDINMPEMDGLELIEVLRASPETQNMPILVISTEGAEDIIEKAKILGVKGFVRKPFTPEKIGEALKQAAG